MFFFEATKWRAVWLAKSDVEVSVWCHVERDVEGKGEGRGTFCVYVCFFTEEEVDELVWLFETYGYHERCPA